MALTTHERDVMINVIISLLQAEISLLTGCPVQPNDDIRKHTKILNFDDLSDIELQQVFNAATHLELPINIEMCKTH